MLKTPTPNEQETLLDEFRVTIDGLLRDGSGTYFITEILDACKSQKLKSTMAELFCVCRQDAEGLIIFRSDLEHARQDPPGFFAKLRG